MDPPSTDATIADRSVTVGDRIDKVAEYVLGQQLPVQVVDEEDAVVGVMRQARALEIFFPSLRKLEQSTTRNTDVRPSVKRTGTGTTAEGLCLAHGSDHHVFLFHGGHRSVCRRHRPRTANCQSIARNQYRKRCGTGSLRFPHGTGGGSSGDPLGP